MGRIRSRPGIFLLIIQMQGAQINSSNNSSYGAGNGTGSGYLNNGVACWPEIWNMLVANNTVPTTGAH